MVMICDDCDETNTPVLDSRGRIDRCIALGMCALRNEWKVVPKSRVIRRIRR